MGENLRMNAAMNKTREIGVREYFGAQRSATAQLVKDPFDDRLVRRHHKLPS